MRAEPHACAIPAADVAPLLAAAARVGAEVPPGATIDLADYFRLLRRLSEATGEETFGLSERPMKRGAAEFVVSAAAGAGTLGEAMERVAQAYNLMHGGDYNRVERHGPVVGYVIADEGYPYTRPHDGYLHLTMECALIWVHAAMTELSGEPLGARVRRVATRRPEGEAVGESVLRFWEARVTRGAPAYALAYDAEVAALPVRRGAAEPDAYLAVHRRILDLIEARRDPDAAGGPVAAVRRLLVDGVREQEEAARRLGVSTATLRRRLSEAGVSFRDLRHEAMNAYARRRLAQHAGVGDVAEELGFSDPRAFTRAFKAWNGATPTGWVRSS